MPRSHCVVVRSNDDIEWLVDLTRRTGGSWEGDIAAAYLYTDGVVYVAFEIVDGELRRHCSCPLVTHREIHSWIPESNEIELLHSDRYDHAKMLAFLRLLPNRATDGLPVNLQKHRLPTDSPFCGVHPAKSKRKIIPVLLP